MSYLGNEPSSVAARYRVQRGAEGFGLYAKQGTFPSLDIKRQGAFLRLMATPKSVHWHVSERWNAFHLVSLRVEKLTIGFSGDEGFSSPLANNCFFVIDGEELRYVELTELRILSEEQFLLEQVNIARERGKEVAVEAILDENANHPLARANIVHCSPKLEDNVAETLECTVGLPSEYFQKLLDGCFNRCISQVHLHGIGGALSSSFEHGTPRDLILCANEGCDIKIDSVVFDYRI